MADPRLRSLHSKLRACRRCQEAGYPITPGAIFSGGAEAQVMIVGQAPGAKEVATGLPFSGPAGKKLFDWLAEAGWKEDEFRAEQYITAVTKCFPGKQGGRGDRLPSARERGLCAPYLSQELKIIQPKLIIPVGRVAINRFLGKEKLTRLVGDVHERNGRLFLPLPHPSGANLWLNRPQSKRLLHRALERLSFIKSSMRL